MIQIYTDGACSPNPGVGGWGAIIKTPTNEYSISGYNGNSTNQRMELKSVIEAFKTLNTLVPGHITNNEKIEVYSDSQYVISTLTKFWRRNANIDLWNELDVQIRNFTNIEWIWVKGHASNEYNNKCDRLAVEARLLCKTNDSVDVYVKEPHIVNAIPVLNANIDNLKNIYVCSPYRGDIITNVYKAKKYCQEIVKLGYMPIAPHLYFTQFMDDNNESERKKAFEFNKRLIEYCSELWVADTDEITSGMQEEIDYAKSIDKPTFKHKYDFKRND